jgi:hypothetical protein
MKKESTKSQKFDTRASLQGVNTSRKQDIMAIKAKHKASDTAATTAARSEKGNIDVTDYGH